LSIKGLHRYTSWLSRPRVLRATAAAAASAVVGCSAAVVLIAPGAVASAAPACTPQTASFAETGAAQSFTVPAGVTSADVVVSGASGTSVQVYGPKQPNLGMASIKVDGGSAVMADQYASSRQPRQLLWSATGLTSGQHTVTISVSGQKNSASTGTGIQIDAVHGY
jgi:hypothetical protein